MEELIYPDAIDAPNFGGFINISSEPIIQGIIVKVEKIDPSAGGYAEYFDKQPTSHNFIITLQLINYDENEVYKNKGFSGIQEFYLLEYASQLDYQRVKSLEALIKPGNFIQFKSFYFGYGAEQIIYLKNITPTR
jgi:hypothetical protein